MIKTRPYFNHSVEFKKPITASYRYKKLKSVGFNVFNFPSEDVSGCDLLSDSGTTTMTNTQWAKMLIADEAYGSNRGYFELINTIASVFGQDFIQHFFLFHQGRAAEDSLFTALGKLQTGQIIPSNGHFDTTMANIEANHIKALDLFSPNLHNLKSDDLFKGNIDIYKLEDIIKKESEKIPVIFLTITNNTAGGQPVSMENIKEVRKLSEKFSIPLFFDACRFAENAYFIKQHEKGYKGRKITEIVLEMFSLVDGFTISFKKDGLANMGGGLFLKTRGLFIKKLPQILETLTDHQILTEGHPTYGGISGRDLATISAGLKIVLREDYLFHRISQVQDFGQKMKDLGLPVLTPFGGSAIYLDMDKFFVGTDFKPEDFGGISLTAILLAKYGHRACELGNFAFGKYNPKAKKEILPKVNFVRFAVPRLRYEREDLESVAYDTKVLYDKRKKLPKVKVIYGRDLPLRHFKAKFDL